MWVLQNVIVCVACENSHPSSRRHSGRERRRTAVFTGYKCKGRKENSTWARHSTVSPCLHMALLEWKILWIEMAIGPSSSPGAFSALPNWRKKDRGKKASLEPYLSLKSCQDIFYVAYPWIGDIKGLITWAGLARLAGLLRCGLARLSCNREVDFCCV